jgi:regulator of protease activity HflC (stomatin/prohibitin superfamily)
MIVLYAVEAAVCLGALWLCTNLRVVKQYERGVVFRFGRAQTGVRAPGLTMLIPIADRLTKVNMQIVTMPVPAQDGITRDNVTVRVDAVIYFNVADPVRVAVDVQDYTSAIGQVAQTSLRSIIGKSDLDDLLSNREHLNQGLEIMIDSPALGWGVHIDRVEIKDVILPDSMKRSMSRQAEAERERRARIITADGELQASEKLAQAAEVMAEHPAALQLRLLQTVVEVAAEKNSTLVLPFPVELLRFLEKATPQHGVQETAGAGPAEPVALPTGEIPHGNPPPMPDDPRDLPLESVAGQPFRLTNSFRLPTPRRGPNDLHNRAALGSAGADFRDRRHVTEHSEQGLSASRSDWVCLPRSGCGVLKK